MKDYPSHPQPEHLITETINVELALSAGKSSYELIESNLEKSNVIGIFMRGAAAGRKTKNNLAFPASNVYQCGFLTITSGINNVIQQIPLEHLIAAPGEYVKLNFPDGIKTTDCKVTFADSATPQNATGLEFNFVVTRKDC